MSPADYLAIIAWGAPPIGCVWLAGRNRVLAELAVILTMAWAGYSLSLVAFGYAVAPVPIAAINGVLMLGVLIILVDHGALVALFIAGCFLVEAAFQAGSFAHHIQGSRAYYTGLNVISIVELLIVGGAGGIGRLAHWLSGFRTRPHAWLHRAVSGGGAKAAQVLKPLRKERMR